VAKTIGFVFSIMAFEFLIVFLFFEITILIILPHAFEIINDENSRKTTDSIPQKFIV
jgi:hypothetical protein